MIHRIILITSTLLLTATLALIAAGFWAPIRVERSFGQSIASRTPRTGERAQTLAVWIDRGCLALHYNRMSDKLDPSQLATARALKRNPAAQRVASWSLPGLAFDVRNLVTIDHKWETYRKGEEIWQVRRCAPLIVQRVTVGASLGLLVPLFAALPVSAYIKGPLRRRRRQRNKQCIGCGYNLAGNESGVCPECGAPK